MKKKNGSKTEKIKDMKDYKGKRKVMNRRRGSYKNRRTEDIKCEIDKSREIKDNKN